MMNLDQFKNDMMQQLVEPLVSLVEDWDEEAANVDGCKAEMLQYLETLIDPDDAAIVEQAEDLVEILRQKVL